MTSETWAPIPASVQTWDLMGGGLAWATSQTVGKWWIMTGGISNYSSFFSYWDILPIYALDLEAWEWYAPPDTTQFVDKIYNQDGLAITIDNPAGLVRADGASSCVVDGNKMLVYVGWQCYDEPTLACPNRPTQQIIIDPTTDSQRWTVTPAPIIGAAPKVAYSTSTSIKEGTLGNSLLLFGGQYVNDYNAVFVTNQILILNLTTMAWDEIVVENAAQISLRASSAGIYFNSSFYFLGGHAWDGGTADLWQLLPGAGADINQAVLSGDLLKNPGVAGVQTELSFSLKNVDGSAVTLGGAYVTGTLIQMQGSNGIAIAAIDLQNGTYTIPLLQFSSGEFLLDIYLNGDLYHAPGIPVSFRPSEPQLTKSSVIAGGSAAGLWEDAGAFAITLVDIYGNVVTSDAAEGLTGLSATFESDGLALTPTSMDGALYLTYEGRKAGRDSVNVKLNGQHMAGSPFDINIITAKQISYNDPAIAMATVFNVLGCLLSLLTFLWILKERNTHALRHASPTILAILALAHAALFLGNIFGPTFAAASCYIREWTLFCGATAVLALLLGKTGRLYILFIGRPMRKMKITDGQLMKLAGILVGVAAILLSVKNALVSWTLQRSELGTPNEAWSCQTAPRYSGATNVPAAWNAVLLVWAAGLGTALLYLAYQTRDCLKKSQESRIIVAQFLIVAATVIAYGGASGATKDLSAVKQFYIEVWLVCFDIYVSLLAIVAVNLNSVQNLYAKVWNGASSARRSSAISSTGGMTEEEEVPVSMIPDDRRISGLPSPTDRKGSNAANAADASLRALRWRDEARPRGTIAYPCSLRVASGTRRLLPWLVQWDVGLLLVNTAEGMCALAPGVFSADSASAAIDLRQISAMTWHERTVKIETSTVVAHVRLPSAEQIEALKLHLQPLTK
ncbi:hypothetical protein HDU87_008402 [Geranomyces variabilis]|uniref:G-protein coupled receptors family 3 profile domain-containing protein n=1 Tax=Geranomyces variabilis TaxID=109894 RepID=A0AAD5XJ14_9FUNG|nr:hypothetical protein HDU87_008402 [Geranomyces variabilis]